MPAALTGVLLLNMGGPDSLAAVEPFLFNLFNDNDIIPLPLGGLLLQRPLARLIASRRSRFVRDYYRRIGGRSPIGKITHLQAERLERRLNRGRPAEAPAYRCYVAMRYWHPFAGEALEAMRRDGVRRIVALTLYPHYTTATTGSSLRELRRLLTGPPARLGDLAAAEVLEIDRYYDHPLYLDALARRVRRVLCRFPAEERARVTILFSAHGLPVTFVARGDPYVEHLHTTITGVIARLAQSEGFVPDWRLSFQSRAGRTRWLEPATDEMLRRLAAEGRRDVLAVPISFVSDHVETLYEMDMLLGDEARALGLGYRRAPALNGEPLFTEALAALVEARVGTASAADPAIIAADGGNATGPRLGAAPGQADEAPPHPGNAAGQQPAAPGVER